MHSVFFHIRLRRRHLRRRKSFTYRGAVGEIDLSLAVSGRGRARKSNDGNESEKVHGGHCKREMERERETERKEEGNWREWG